MNGDFDERGEFHRPDSRAPGGRLKDSRFYGDLFDPEELFIIRNHAKNRIPPRPWLHAIERNRNDPVVKKMAEMVDRERARFNLLSDAEKIALLRANRSIPGDLES